MNWKEISEQYPKAFRLLYRGLMYSGWDADESDAVIDEDLVYTGLSIHDLFEQEYLVAHEDSPWNWRNLYDFFDGKGIYVEVFNHKDYIKFGYSIRYHISGITWGGDAAIMLFDTRVEAEEAAFVKTFEILEAHL